MTCDAESRQRQIERVYRIRVKAARKSAKKRLAYIKQHADAGRTRQVQSLERLLMRSKAYSLYCADRARVRLAWLDRQRARKSAIQNDHPYDPGVQRGPTLEVTIATAERVNLWEPTQESVSVVLINKTNKPGLHRAYSGGIERRTRDEMVRVILTNRANLHRGQCAPGRGMAQLQDSIEEAIRSGEYKVALVSDVIDCFGTVEVTALPAVLDLPAAVVQATIGFEQMNVDPASERVARRRENAHDIAQAQIGEDQQASIRRSGPALPYRFQHCPGIPKGPSCSPIVAEYIIAECLRGAPEGVQIITWVDDVLILARNRRDAERAFSALRLAFARARGGNFRLKEPRIRRVCDGFDFVGFRFRRRGFLTEVSPSAANINRFYLEVERRLHRLAHYGEGREQLERYLRGWFSAFRRWSRARNLQAAYLRTVNQATWAFPIFYHGRLPADRRGSDRAMRRVFGRGFPPPRSAPRQCGSWQSIWYVSGF